MQRAFLLALALLLAGCAAPDDPEDVPNKADTPEGTAPAPTTLAGVDREPLVVDVAPGIQLAGFLWLPARDAGDRLPLVLSATPYPLEGDPDEDGAIPRATLVANGYAVAAFNVRGTGGSDGCFEQSDPAQATDLAALIDDLAARSWSNGRVGMIGISASTPPVFLAAIQAPPALKTIIVSGIIADEYTFHHSLQGAMAKDSADYETSFVQEQRNDNDCGPVRGGEVLAQGAQTNDRDASWWAPRDHLVRFSEITASVLLAHGFLDLWESGHDYQEDIAWDALTQAKKWQIIGQWGHDFPSTTPTGNDWGARVLAWLDHELKGAAQVPDGFGRVDYEDSEGQWHASSRWPPAEARLEALFFDGAGGLAAKAGSTDLQFTPTPPTEDADEQERALDAVACGNENAFILATTQIEGPVLLAGNPYALLRMSSASPGGLVTLDLVKLAADAGCDGADWTGATRLTSGAADLRFHSGDYTGRDFPVDTPTTVRIDLPNLAHAFSPGDRLAVLVSHGDGFRVARDTASEITIHPESHIVLPLVEGTLGGAAPTIAPPPRPFAPIASEA